MKLILPAALAIMFTAACDTPHTHVYREYRTYYNNNNDAPPDTSSSVEVYAPAYESYGGYVRPPEDEKTHILGSE